MSLDPHKLRAREPVTTQAFILAVRRWVRRYFYKPSLVDTVTQETMVEMFAKLDAGNIPAPERVRGWISTCVHNAVRREQTRLRARDALSYESTLHITEQPNVSEQVAHREDLRRIDAQLHRATERAQQVFTMRLLGHSHEDIAKQIDAKSGATRMIYLRLVQQLVTQLADQGALNIDVRQHESSIKPT